MSTVLVQNVNLYLPEFRRKTHWLDAKKMLLLIAGSVLLLAIVSGVEYWQLSTLRAELAAKEDAYQAAARATVALLDEFGVQTEDASLLDSIAALEADLQNKQALLQFLEGREAGNAAGFSEHMADLSRYHLDGLSLTRIGLSNGGRDVELEGQVLEAELVTLYLQNLRKSTSYAGKKFEMLDIDSEVVTAASAEDSSATTLPVWSFRLRTLHLGDAARSTAQ